jgi:hypothetical protein
MARRVALRRPRPETIAALEAESADCDEDEARRTKLMAEIEALKAKIPRIPVHRSDRHPIPPFRDGAEAGRAGRHVLPDGRVRLDDRAYEGSRQALLHAALRVPEAALSPRRDRLHPAYRPGRGGRRDTFFHGPASGGTLVSSALQAMHEIVGSRFRPADWNIYAAQASDGDNSYRRRGRGRLLTEKILPVSQFFAYLEVGQDAALGSKCPDSSLWTLYQRLRADGAPLSMRKVTERSEIFPVFHDLFQRRGSLQERAAHDCDNRTLFEGADWDFQTLQRIHDACEEIARD